MILQIGKMRPSELSPECLEAISCKTPNTLNGEDVFAMSIYILGRHGYCAATVKVGRDSHNSIRFFYENCLLSSFKICTELPLGGTQTDQLKRYTELVRENKPAPDHVHRFHNIYSGIINDPDIFEIQVLAPDHIKYPKVPFGKEVYHAYNYGAGFNTSAYEHDRWTADMYLVFKSLYHAYEMPLRDSGL